MIHSIDVLEVGSGCSLRSDVPPSDARSGGGCRGQVDSAIDSAKSAKSSLKFRTVEEIDAEIRKLETTQVGGAGRQT